ncbi:MAG: hypothetical protein EA388_01525 [Nitriliruptor sp.]|nr:MAG: hypothetical protein EA388_01525 [Nitriliruptor sp.]
MQAAVAVDDHDGIVIETYEPAHDVRELRLGPGVGCRALGRDAERMTDRHPVADVVRRDAVHVAGPRPGTGCALVHPQPPA